MIIVRTIRDDSKLAAKDELSFPGDLAVYGRGPQGALLTDNLKSKNSEDPGM